VYKGFSDTSTDFYIFMISRNKAKFIKSLQLKKFRKQEGAFVVEGTKSALEIINADYKILMLVATDDFLRKHGEKFSGSGIEIIEAAESELSSLGHFKTNSEILLVVKTKQFKLNPIKSGEYVLALDNIQDPGNMGTIIRIADWYGIDQIIASHTSAELYNPKVLQSSMGSFVRVNIFYTELEAFFGENRNLKVYGAVLEGKTLHDVVFSKGGAILIGNESIGINKQLMPYIHEKISIPKYGLAESLNAAIAAAVICDRMKISIGSQ
jgi:RNA methyltransferase, TrmH family